MGKKSRSQLARLKRKASIRKSIIGTQEKPRMSVFKSAKHIYVQVIDDSNGATLASVSTISKDFKDEIQGLKKVDAAKKIGMKIAERCKQEGVNKIVFDRNGYIYHGRVAALADGAREGGLSF